MARFLLSFAVCVSLMTPTYAAPRLSVLHTSYAFRLLGLKVPSPSSRRTSSSRTEVTITGNTIRGPGTVNDKTSVKGSTSGEVNPEKVGMFGPGADLNTIGSTNPADLNMMGSTNPADINMMGSTNPADLNMMGSTNPADLNMMGSTNPADFNMMGSINPADINMMRSTNPADLNMMGSTNPADLNMMGTVPAFRDSSHEASVGGPYIGYPEITSGKYANLGPGTGPSSQSQGYMEMILPDNFQVGSGGILTEGSLGSTSQQGMMNGGKSGPQGSIKTGVYPENTSGKYSNLGPRTGQSAQSQGYMEMILPDNFQVGSGGILTEGSLGSTSQQGMMNGGKSGPHGSTKTGMYPERVISQPGPHRNAGKGMIFLGSASGSQKTQSRSQQGAGNGMIYVGTASGSQTTGPQFTPGMVLQPSSTLPGTGPGTQSQGYMEMILPDNFQVGSGGILTEGSLGSTTQQGMKNGGKSGPQGSTKTGVYPENTSGKYSNLGPGTGPSAQSQGYMEMILPDNFQVGSGGILTEGSLGSTTQQGMMNGGKSGPQGSTKTGVYPEITSGKYSKLESRTRQSAQSQGHMEMIVPDNFQVGSGGILTEGSLGSTSQQGMMNGGKSGPQGSTKTGVYPENTSGKYSTLESRTGQSAQSQGHMEMIVPDNFQVGSGGILTEGSLGSTSQQGMMNGGKSGPQGSTKTGMYPEITSGKYSTLESRTGQSAQSQGHMEMIVPDNFQVGSGGILTEGSLGSTSQQGMMNGGKSGPQGSTKTGVYPENTSGKYSNLGPGTGPSAQSQGYMEMILPDNFQVGSGGILTEGSLGLTSQHGMMNGGKSGPQGSTKTGVYPENTSGKYSNLGPGTGPGTQSQSYMEMILPDNFQVGSGGILTEGSFGSTSQQGMLNGGKSGPQGSTKTGVYPEITPGKYSKLESRTGQSAQSQGHMEMIVSDNFQVGSGGILTEGSLGSTSQQGMMNGGKSGPQGSTKTGVYPENTSGKYSNLGPRTGQSAQSQGYMEMILPDNFQVGSGGILTEGSLGSTSQQGMMNGGKSGPHGSTKTGMYPERVISQPGPHRNAGKGMIFLGSASGSQKTQSRSQQGAGNGMIYVGTASGSQTTGPQFTPGMVLQPSSTLPQGGVVTFVDGGDVTVRSQGQVQIYEAGDLMP